MGVIPSTPVSEESEVNRCLVVGSAIVLASCAATAGYENVLSSWAGAQEVELVRGWGQPVKSYEASGRKFIVYESRRSFHLPGTAPFHTSTGTVSGSPAMDIEMFCSTTFELESSKVISWSYKGNDCNPKKWAPFRA